MVKVRVKSKEPPPPDAETKKQYEACGAAPLPSHLRRATNNPANAGSKRSTPTRRTPRISGRTRSATRRPSRPSSRSSDAPLAARRLAAVPCYDRDTRRVATRGRGRLRRDADDVRVLFGNKHILLGGGARRAFHPRCRRRYLAQLEEQRDRFGWRAEPEKVTDQQRQACVAASTTVGACYGTFAGATKRMRSATPGAN